jgi:hypothetical protein
MHPLLHLIAIRPQLLAGHAQAYADLVAMEWPRARSAWRRQALLKVLAWLSLTSAVLLGGMALMLWAVLPMLSMPTPWLLVAVPLLPASVGAACLVAARNAADDKMLDILRQQLSADLAMLRAAGLAR